jgi:hypothetical protein
LVQRLGETAYVYDVSIIEDHRSMAVCALRKILKDDGWLKTWGDKKAVIKSIKNQISDLEDPDCPFDCDNELIWHKKR